MLSGCSGGGNPSLIPGAGIYIDVDYDSRQIKFMRHPGDSCDFIECKKFYDSDISIYFLPPDTIIVIDDGVAKIHERNFIIKCMINKDIRWVVDIDETYKYNKYGISDYITVHDLEIIKEDKTNINPRKSNYYKIKVNFDYVNLFIYDKNDKEVFDTVFGDISLGKFH